MCLLVLVFLWNPYGFQVEDEVIGLREPKNRLVSAREFPPSMKPMLPRPDDAVARSHSKTMGAGTVAVVARDLNRHFVGAELDSTYHQIAVRRLSGEPDENGSFPNLKTLRSYCERTGKPAHMFRFDVQVGKFATELKQSKIYSEEHHLAEFEERLDYEESAFGSKLRGEAIPVDPKLNGSAKPTPPLMNVPSLFD